MKDEQLMLRLDSICDALGVRRFVRGRVYLIGADGSRTVAFAPISESVFWNIHRGLAHSGDYLFEVEYSDGEREIV